MEDAVHLHFKGLKLFLTTLFVSLGTFLIALDQFIANVSIPTIAGELGVSDDQGSWVITSFTVANAIMVPLTGWLTSLIGRVRLFCLSSILFSLMSWLCGLSTSLQMLVIFRVLQGAVSGALIPLSQSILMTIFPPEKKGVAIGFWGLVVMVGPAMGPVLGGWITDNYGWSWIFYINVPIGILVGIATFLLMSSFESERKKLPIDGIGLTLFIVGIASLQILLDKGYDLDWWQSHVIIALTIVTVVTLTFFVIWELFHPHPVIDLTFFKSRNFTLGTSMISVIMLFLFGSFILVPIWVQDELGYTPLWAGYTLAPIGLFAVILFPMLGFIMHWFDLRIWVAISLVLFSFTFFWLSSLNIHAPFSAIALPRLFQGIGFALFYIPLTAISLAGISTEKLPSAAGLFSFVRMLFVSIGVSFSVNLWYHRETFYQSRLVEYVVPSNPAYHGYLSDLEFLGLTGVRAQAFLNQVVMNQSYTLAILDIFYLAGWCFILLILLLFAFRSPKQRI